MPLIQSGPNRNDNNFQTEFERQHKEELEEIKNIYFGPNSDPFSNNKVCMPTVERQKTITEQLYGIHETLLGTLDLANCIADKIRNCNEAKQSIVDESVKKSRNGIAPCIDEIGNILYMTNSILSEALSKM